MRQPGGGDDDGAEDEHACDATQQHAGSDDDVLLGVRLDKMLKLTLLRGGPAQELLPGRELPRYDRAGPRFSLHSNITKP